MSSWGYCLYRFCWIFRFHFTGPGSVVMATSHLAPLKFILILLITSWETWFGLEYPRSITEPFTDVETTNLMAHRQLLLSCSNSLMKAKRMSNKSKLRRRQLHMT